MNSKKLQIFKLIFLLCTFLISCQKQEQIISLTAQEQQWLNKNGNNIRVAQDPTYPPLGLRDKNGNIVGISNDYLKIFEKRLNIKFILLHKNTLNENLILAKTHKVDIVTSIAKTPQRSEFLLFTNPYFQTPAVIIINGKANGNVTLKELTNKKISVTNRYAVHDYLDINYPELQLDLVPNDLVGLKKLVFNETDALIADLGSVSFHLKRSGISNLHVAGNTDFVYQIAMGVRKDLPILHSILNKTMATITK